MQGLLYCSGEVTFFDGLPRCSIEWSVVPYSAPFDPSQLDPIQLAQAFGSGFTLVATFMVMSMGVRAFLTFVKRL